MVRNRFPSSSRDPRYTNRDNPRDKVKKSNSKWTIFYLISGCAMLIGIGYLFHQGSLETKIHTPVDLPLAVEKTGLQVPKLFWGSYRPGLYFGMKTRSPSNLLFGLMWMIPELLKQNDIGFRHWSEEGDNLERFGWIQHDGENFGVQEIIDRGLKFTTSFVKKFNADSLDRGGSWTARIKVEKKHKRIKVNEIILFLYAAMDENSSGYKLRPVFGGSDAQKLTGIVGKTVGLGEFSMDFVTGNGNENQAHHTFHSLIDSSGPGQFTSDVQNRLRMIKTGESGPNIIGPDPQGRQSSDPNLIVHQINAKLPFEIDVVFNPSSMGKNNPLTGDEFSRVLLEKQNLFNENFEKTFGLQKLGFNQSQIDFAQAAMSNMIGGIGYFYGHSKVRSKYNLVPVRYWDSALYTGVPSRTRFPRGFLWDEGFHNLLISKWNKKLSAEILAHWLDLMNIEGWIPREQFLGKESRVDSVDEKFVVQRNEIANPPTLLLTLHSMVNDLSGNELQWMKPYLNRLWPRLDVWINWFNSTQYGPKPGSFRWRDRNATTVLELNPKTLSSGLDDFPRASHPTDQEYHVDLRCWMALASKLMVNIGKLIGKNYEKYTQMSELLNDQKSLDELHWSDQHGAYLDYGLHSEDITLQRPQSSHPNQRLDKQRKVHEEPSYQFVNQVGYISLFPFLVEIVDAKSPKLGKILEDIKNPSKFWTDYGLRSLSKSASIYKKRNTEHDPPYWRGPIWININYLAVRALHSYASKNGPYQSEAQNIYTKLREALINNMFNQYQKTGYIWEQYDDRTGKPTDAATKPFTGWSALILLIMGENY